MTLNLAGWFGTAIVGTLHTFFPSLTQTHLRFAALQRPTFACWTLGTAALATGYGLGAGPLVLAGWTASRSPPRCCGTNLVASLRASPTGLTLPARLIAAAQACLVLGLSLAFARRARRRGHVAAAGFRARSDRHPPAARLAWAHRAGLAAAPAVRARPRA